MDNLVDKIQELLPVTDQKTLLIIYKILILSIYKK